MRRSRLGILSSGDRVLTILFNDGLAEKKISVFSGHVTT